MFRNREEAGELLADRLIAYKDHPDAIVIAVPRGGLVPGKVIAEKLHLPLELALVKKIGHPSNPEYAIGAVSIKNRILDKGHSIQEEYIQQETEKNRSLLEERMELFYGKKKPIDLTNKILLLVDDGIATGNTLRAAIELLNLEKPAQIILAVPVAPKEAINELSKVADKIICLNMPISFHAIGAFYENFAQISDHEALELFKSVQ